MAASRSRRHVGIEIARSIGDEQRGNAEGDLQPGDLFMRSTTFLEWAGDATGTVAFLWATVVVLGGFCTLINPEDFWCTTTIIFIEAFRLFTQTNSLSRTFFKTMMGMGASNSVPTSIRHWLLHDRSVFFTTLVLTCILDRVITLSPFTVRGLLRIAEALGIIILRFIPFRVNRQVRENQWPVIVCFLAVFVTLSAKATYKAWKKKLVHLFIFTIIDILVQSLAVLFISLKPTIVVHLINYPRCRKFFRLIKVFISLSLAGEHAVLLGFQAVKDAGLWAEKGAHIYMDLPKSLVTVVLSVTGLQTQDGHVGFWIELSLLISLVVEWSSSFGSLTNAITCALIILIVGVGMVTGNLQITTSIARLVLSLLRICGRKLSNAYPTTLHPNLLHTIHVFYWLVICQGSLYLAACVFGAFAKAPGPAATDQDTSATSTAQEISTVLHPSDVTQDQTPPRCFIVGAISVPLP